MSKSAFHAHRQLPLPPADEDFASGRGALRARAITSWLTCLLPPELCFLPPALERDGIVPKGREKNDLKKWLEKERELSNVFRPGKF